MTDKKSKLSSIENSVRIFEDWSMFLLIALASCLGMYQIILRYLFSWGNDWVEAYMIMFIVYAALIAASVAVRRNIHVKLDVIVKQCSLKVQWYVNIIANSLCLIYTACLWLFGCMFVEQVIRYDDINILSDLPEWVHYMAVPIGMGLMSIRYFQELYFLIKVGPTYEMKEIKHL